MTCPTDHTCSDGRPLKYEEGKPKVGLVPPQLARDLARVYEYGLTKYERDSWKKFTLEGARELINPSIRHADEYRDGRYVDDESQCYHLMQAIWNLFTIHWHELDKNPEYRRQYEELRFSRLEPVAGCGGDDAGLPDEPPCGRGPDNACADGCVRCYDDTPTGEAFRVLYEAWESSTKRDGNSNQPRKAEEQGGARSCGGRREQRGPSFYRR